MMTKTLAAMSVALIASVAFAETQKKQPAKPAPRASAQPSPSPSPTLVQPAPMRQSEAKTRLGPHAVVIQTALRNALDELKGLRAQYEVAPPDNHGVAGHAREHRRELADELRTAWTHQGELQRSIDRFHEIAQSESFKSEIASFREARLVFQDWQGRSSNPAYWGDRNQVMNDLDTLEKRLGDTLGKVQSFSTDQLNVSVFG